MKNIFCFFAILCFTSLGYSSERSCEDVDVTAWQPTSCLAMLAKKFQEPHHLSMAMFGKFSLKDIATGDLTDCDENHGIRWGWTLPPGHEIGIWDAKTSCAISLIIDQKYALSYLNLQAFYQFYDHLEAGSNMKKLWHEFFGEQPEAGH